MSRPDDLATMVRDAAPRPDAEFLERLDARVAERFGAPERPRRAWPRWRIAGGLAAAGAAAVIAVVVVGGDERSGTGSPSPQHALSAEPSTTAGTPSEAARQAAGAPPAPSAAVAPAGPKRRVIRDTQLALTAAPKDFAATTDGVFAVSDRFGGIVQRSSVDQNGSTGHATFDLRVPAARLDDAMTALSRLAHVKSRSAASQDVTAEYLSASERLADARAERRGILRSLAKADTAGETAALRIRLREVNARLTQARGEVRSLKLRTDYVQVAVTVDAAKRGEAIPGTGDTNDRWTPGDARPDAGRPPQPAAGIALLPRAIGLPRALLGGLFAPGGRAARRRRREAALG